MARDYSHDPGPGQEEKLLLPWLWAHALEGSWRPELRQECSSSLTQTPSVPALARERGSSRACHAAAHCYRMCV